MDHIRPSAGVQQRPGFRIRPATLVVAAEDGAEHIPFNGTGTSLIIVIVNGAGRRSSTTINGDVRRSARKVGGRCRQDCDGLGALIAVGRFIIYRPGPGDGLCTRYNTGGLIGIGYGVRSASVGSGCCSGRSRIG